MTTRPLTVCVIQGRGQRDYVDCQTALDRVPARLESLPFIGDAEEVIQRARGADGLIVSSSPVTRRVMEALEGLKVVMRTGVGYDVIDVEAAAELGVVVINVPDIWLREVANHALALLLAWNRRIVTLDREVRAGVWGSRVPGPVTGSLHGETVGIVGLGNIGSAFARRVAALETRVIACDPYVDAARFEALGVERVDLMTLAARADYVSVHALLSPETSAALDVFEEEPLGADSPLRDIDNVILTPHAAYFSSPAVAQVPRRCGEEVARVLMKERPLNVVNPEVYAPGHRRRGP